MVQMTAHNGIPKKFEQVNEKETFLVYYRRMKILENVNIALYTCVCSHLRHCIRICIYWPNEETESVKNTRTENLYKYQCGITIHFEWWL